MRIRTLMAGCLLLLVVAPALAQDNPPYLYHYSRLLGGLVIERADGSDSRLIGADVIPPDLTGLEGAGWSPSGGYFAAYGIIYGDYNATRGMLYLIDAQGRPVAWQIPPMRPGLMTWAPGEDLLLIASENEIPLAMGSRVVFYLVDAASGETLVEYGSDLSFASGGERTPFVWDMRGRNLQFYVRPEIHNFRQISRVTLAFDGRVSVTPASEAEFMAADVGEPASVGFGLALGDGQSLSPSGAYRVRGSHPPTLEVVMTGEEITLPRHSRATACRDYLWTDDERHMITRDGTVIAGGGCGGVVLGVTDVDGKLWRELGGCSWSAICAGWLPPQVDIAALPPGQAQSVQVDPVTYEAVTDDQGGWDVLGDTGYTMICAPGQPLAITQSAEDAEYVLDEPCGDRLFEVPASVAFEPRRGLLATWSRTMSFVTLWSLDSEPATPIIRLDSLGRALAFTADGERLRALNFSAWKIYALDDLLDAAGGRYNLE